MQITLTSFLATYAAIISSIGLGWSLYKDLHDRARLKVVAHFRRIARAEGTGQTYAVAAHLNIAGASQQLFVFIDVTNVGRRPVRWDGWGGNYHQPSKGKDSFAIVPVNLPKMLDEGDSHSEYTDELHAAIDNVKRIFVWDAAGKNWYLPRSGLKKLKKQIMEIPRSG